ncbi:hypothetical protein Celal_3740 [Cellulophaga algicola DSM 14237]|uniref:Type VI secretion system baseplate subunit TssF n=1 Tax=Cellulophaga algicola (strain DSM 14237 / IC166 / ACAM 630) TaxID=688270 RepID=E6XAM7_CELAD|nr:type VI secretion system baseplate subunit TssF [Cellulophaga algicola]ADV50989.1 hypothetical protein Celal_3740 [Cellulophaga algicola DSM 14237]
MKSLSKEEIKERLIRRAADTWGMDEMEIEYSLDPIISILFDACSHEFERISDTIKSSRTRITERLVDLLTPQVSVTARPAHAVMHALPIDSNLNINERSEFYHRKRMPIFRENGKNDFEDFFFAPAGAFKLSNCSLDYIAYPEKIASHKAHRNIPFISKDNFVGTPDGSSIYLGIKPDEETSSIQDLLCYFDLLNFSQKNVLTHQLGLSKWSLNGTPLEVVNGYNELEFAGQDLNTYINESIQSKIKFYENYVKEFYQEHFYTITDTISVKDNLKDYPEDFENFLSEKDLKEFNTPLLWIKISFSSIVSSKMLDNLHCHINCFPVLNKKRHETNRRLKSYFNILPLEIDGDYFFDVQDIIGDSGNTYFIQDRKKEDTSTSTQAYLRFGGVSRFDERDASELLNYTIDLLKEDSIAFNAMNDDFINTNLKDLKQIISRIDQQIELRDFTKNKIPYLVINKNSINKNKDQFVFTNYWSTAGDKANKINPYVQLVQYSGTAFLPNSLTFITGTIGGKDEPSASEKIYAYREHILSKGKIITRQDIIQHCFGIFKDSIKKVTIEKGVVVALEEGIGYTPTTDVYITKHEDAVYDEESWEHLKKEVLIGLQSRSANVLPFRIFYS